MNDQNLKPFGTRAVRVEREIQSKGGKKRVENIREAKTFASALSLILNEQVSDDNKLTKKEAICIRLVKKIFDNPDIRDVKLLAELMGESTQTMQNILININGAGITQEELNELY